MKKNISILPLSSLFFAIGFLAIGYGMILTFIGIYLKDKGVDDFNIGLINASFFLGAILSSIFSQSIISKVGHIRSFSTFASIMIISFLIHSIYFNEFLWGILRAISGFSFYSLLIIIESWLNEKSNSQTRSKILSAYTVVFYLAIAFGQIFLNISENLKQSIFTIGSVLILFSVVFISLTKIKEPKLEPFTKYSLPKIFSLVPLALSASLISGIVLGTFYVMIPVYIIIKYHSVEVVSYFMMISILGGLISQLPIGTISDKYGRRKTISAVALITAFSSFLFLVADKNINGIYILGFLLGLTIFSIYPLAVTRANDVADENKDIIEISRTLLFTFAVGSFIGPIIIGFIFKFYHESIFIAFIILNIYLCIYALFNKRVKDDDLSTFVNIPVTSGLELPQLDIRNENE